MHSAIRTTIDLFTMVSVKGAGITDGWSPLSGGLKLFPVDGPQSTWIQGLIDRFLLSACHLFQTGEDLCGRVTV